jgi:hypothetical protein
MAASPLASCRSPASCSLTVEPAWAKSWAMPCPITPAPITATTRSIAGTSRLEPYRGEARAAPRLEVAQRNIRGAHA